MTVSSENNRNRYVGTNSTAVFDYSFRILDEKHLKVIEADTGGVENPLVLNTDYTVSGVGEAKGGTITLTAGNLATDHALVILRDLPALQEIDLRNQGGYYPDTLENGLDRLVMLHQAQKERGDRSVRLQETAPSDVKPVLPAPQAGKYVGWSADAKGLVNKENPGSLTSGTASGQVLRWNPASQSYEPEATGTAEAQVPTNADLNGGGSVALQRNGGTLPEVNRNNVFTGATQVIRADASELQLQDSGSALKGGFRQLATNSNRIEIQNRAGAAVVSLELRSSDEDSSTRFSGPIYEQGRVILGKVLDDLSPTTISTDSAWSWFGGPVAVHYAGTQDRTYIGLIALGGDQKVRAYDHATGAIESFTVKNQGSNDDHENPSILVLNDGRIAVFYTDHTSSPIQYRISSSAEDISAFGAEQTINTGSHTYPRVFQRADGRVYLFYADRDNNRDLYYTFSDDLTAWSAPQKLIVGRAAFAGQGIYAQASKDANDRIDFVITGAEGGGDNPKKDVRHFYFQDGVIYGADGTNLGTLPVSFDNVPLVYNSDAVGNYDAWVWDVARRDTGLIEVVYAVFPSINDHQYRYARWEGGVWTDSLLIDAGGMCSEPARTPREGYYSNGVAISRTEEGLIYASVGNNRKSQILEIKTADGQRFYTRSYSDTIGQNIRPRCPESASSDMPVLWMRGGYTHFEEWETDVVGREPAQKESVIPRISTGGARISLSSSVVSGLVDNNKIPFNVVDYDDRDEADIANNQLTVGEDGLYLISASVEYSSSDAIADCGIEITKNGTAFTSGSLYAEKATTKGAAVNVSDVAFLRSGDTIAAILRLTGGVTTDIVGMGGGVSKTYMNVQQLR